MLKNKISSMIGETDTLNNKVAIITGSSRGIGKKIAFKLANAGAAVIVNGRNESSVNEVVSKILAFGGQAFGVIGAVEQMKTGEQLVNEALAKFGRVDILINNAGITRDRISYKMTEQEWDEVINVNLKGAFSCTKAFIKQLKLQKSGGSIINMTSTAGLEGTIGQLNYSAAKAGLIAMTWTLAKELAKDHVQVNAIAPAALTDMTKPLIEMAEQEAKAQNKPLPEYWQVGSPEDVANFVVALLANPDQQLTGKIFAVNGKKIGSWEPFQYVNLLSD